MNTEQIVANINELNDGQMKEIQVEDRTVLLVRVEGEYRAYVSECPHHGAPLVEGCLHEDLLRCPWHQAVFDLRNGERIEPPSLDGLMHYEVKIKGNDVVVVIPQEPATSTKPPKMEGYDAKEDNRTFVILGAGAAGLAAAETLRQERFAGRVVVLTKETNVSYDRTELSKHYLADPDAKSPRMRSDAFYQEHDIEILTGKNVIEADVQTKTVRCDDGSSYEYDKLLIAAGSQPRRLGVEGENLENVFTLRSLADCDRVRQRANQATRAVVVGASFIGMETAAALKQRGLDVTIVAPESTPFQRVFGKAVGQMYRDVHEEKGTRFHLGQEVERFEGKDSVQTVVLNNGETLEADLVLIGVGVQPVTGFLKGLPANDDNSISVNTQLQTAQEDVFAAGDIARFPDWRNYEPIRIEHWRLAQQHGCLAARNMLDQGLPYNGVPFFWTNQHKVVTQFVGHVADWQEIRFDGNPEHWEFLAYYLADDQIHAVAGCGKSHEMTVIGELFSKVTYPDEKRIRRCISKAQSAPFAECLE